MNSPRTLLLLSLTLLTGTAAAATAAEPDTIYYGGKVHTLDPASSVQEAFAVRGDRFVAVGKNAAVLSLVGTRTRLVGLGGATVIPGLSDSHDHLWNSSRYLYRGVDVIGVTSLAQLQERLRPAVAGAKRGEVVFTTTGWSIQPVPTRQSLDAISADVPIALIGNRRGVAVFNSAALRHLGVSKANPLFRGAKVPVDRDGEPLGTAPGYPNGVHMIEALLPSLTRRQQDAMVVQAMAQRNSLGITSVRELALWPESVKALQRMRREGKLTIRMAIGVEFPDQANTAQHLAALPRPMRDDHWLFLDSVSEEPWTPGTVPLDPFTALVHAENQLGWRPAPHVGADLLRSISADDALNQTLAAYETVDHDSSLRGKRWYIEHATLATPEQMDRLAKLGLVVSTQDAGYRPAPVPALPQQRLEHNNPIRGFVDHGLVVIAGSDTNGPTATEREPNNPLIPFYFYVTRKTQSGEVRTPAEKISREQALRMFTTNPAYATFQESVKGQIAAGMLADFVVLNQDLMSVPDEQILATHPLATFVGGKKVYAASASGF